VWHDLLQATKDPAVEVRGAAVKLMAGDRWRDAPAVLTRMLDTEQDPETRRSITKALERLQRNPRKHQ
jgi:hypothetical protein